MNEKMKDNKCLMFYECSHSHYYPCCYFIPSKDDKRKCMYCNNMECISRVAQVNKMVVSLKREFGGDEFERLLSIIEQQS